MRRTQSADRVGLSLASPCACRTIRVWDAKTGETTCTFEGHKDSVTAVAVCTDMSKVWQRARLAWKRKWGVGRCAQSFLEMWQQWCHLGLLLYPCESFGDRLSPYMVTDSHHSRIMVSQGGSVLSTWHLDLTCL